MKARIDACHGAKTRIQALVRRYGYGVPDLARASLSTRNDLTLLVEDEQLQPFQRDGNAAAKTRDMKLHRLPWPKEQLAALGSAQVELACDSVLLHRTKSRRARLDAQTPIRVTRPKVSSEIGYRDGERVQGADQPSGPR